MRLTEQRRRLDITHGKAGGCLGSTGFRALHASEPSFQFRHVERQVPQIHARRAPRCGRVLLHKQSPSTQFRHVERKIGQLGLVVHQIDIVQLRFQQVETERFALDPGPRLDRDPAVRPLDLRIARRRGLQRQIDQILVLRRPPLLERRVHRRGNRIRVPGRVRVGHVVRGGHVVLGGHVLLGRGFLRVVVPIVVRGLGRGLLGRLVGDGGQYVQLVRVVGQETGHRGLLVVVVAIRAAAVRAVGAQAGAVTALRAASRSVPLARAASQRLHAAAAATRGHALCARVAWSASAGAQFEFQQADVPSGP